MREALIWAPLLGVERVALDDILEVYSERTKKGEFDMMVVGQLRRPSSDVNIFVWQWRAPALCDGKCVGCALLSGQSGK